MFCLMTALQHTYFNKIIFILPSLVITEIKSNVLLFHVLNKNRNKNATKIVVYRNSFIFRH